MFHCAEFTPQRSAKWYVSGVQAAAVCRSHFGGTRNPDEIPLRVKAGGCAPRTPAGPPLGRRARSCGHARRPPAVKEPLTLGCAVLDCVLCVARLLASIAPQGPGVPLWASAPLEHPLASTTETTSNLDGSWV